MGSASAPSRRARVRAKSRPAFEQRDRESSRALSNWRPGKRPNVLQVPIQNNPRAK